MALGNLLAVLAREYPNGVSFEPLAVRLLRKRVEIESWQIEGLKAKMFQLNNGLWFSREMISDNGTFSEFEGRALEWLKDHGCFSVVRLFEEFSGVLRHMDTPEACAALLQHLEFNVAVRGGGGWFCFLSPQSLDDCLTTVSKKITEWLEEAGGTLACNEIEQTVPYLSAEALENVRMRLLPHIHRAEVGEVACWHSTESIALPEDFSEKLTTAVDTLVGLDEKVTARNLEFALNILYRMHFRKEHFLLDNDVFMRICESHYLGGNDVFSDSKKRRMRATDLAGRSKRTRSPNTRFCSLGVPIGAELVCTKHSHISCIVFDDINKVEYNGKVWSISTLANHLLGGFSANGFCCFSYRGEVLWDMRSRLESKTNKGTLSAKE